MKLDLPLATIREYCESSPIKHLSLFGSVLSDNFTDTSDIDILLECVEQSTITYFDLFDIQEALKTTIGHEVDILTPVALSEHFRDAVLNEAITIYER